MKIKVIKLWVTASLCSHVFAPSDDDVKMVLVYPDNRPTSVQYAIGFAGISDMLANQILLFQNLPLKKYRNTFECLKDVFKDIHDSLQKEMSKSYVEEKIVENLRDYGVKKIILPGAEGDRYTQQRFEVDNEMHEAGVHNFIASMGHAIIHHGPDALRELVAEMQKGIGAHCLTLPDKLPDDLEDDDASSDAELSDAVHNANLIIPRGSPLYKMCTKAVKKGTITRDEALARLMNEYLQKSTQPVEQAQAAAADDDWRSYLSGGNWFGGNASLANSSTGIAADKKAGLQNTTLQDEEAEIRVAMFYSLFDDYADDPVFKDYCADLTHPECDYDRVVAAMRKHVEEKIASELEAHIIAMEAAQSTASAVTQFAEYCAKNIVKHMPDYQDRAMFMNTCTWIQEGYLTLGEALRDLRWFMKTRYDVNLEKTVHELNMGRPFDGSA